MSDEFEKKRQEKIANFKIEYDDSEDFASIGDISSDLNGADNISSSYDSIDIESGRTIDPEKINSSEISDDLNSYSDNPSDSEQKLDKSELRKARRADRKRRKRKAKKNRVIFRTIWIFMVVLVSIMLGQFIMVGVDDMLAVGREEEKSVSVTIPKDATLDQITDILYSNKIINNQNFFKLYATLTKSTSGFTQGTFDVKTNKDYQALINYMQSDMNRTDVVKIQFAEGLNVLEYAKLLEENNVCKADDFLEMCNSTEFDEDYEFLSEIKNASDRYYRLEGYLFPDTYDFYVGEEPDSVVRRFLSNYRRRIYRTKKRVEGFEKKVTIEERAEAIGMSMDEVIILASLIQAEAANTEDMYMVSSVIHNRLETLKTDGVNENGEAGFEYLQLDSTVYYPYRTEQNVPASIRSTYVSSYSTYKNKGVPAGSICNPGLEAIQAAVSPEQTNYFYFCHKAATGDEPAVAYYAETNSEHLRNQEEAGLI